jgi:hypothetical protein
MERAQIAATVCAWLVTEFGTTLLESARVDSQRILLLEVCLHPGNPVALVE